MRTIRIGDKVSVIHDTVKGIVIKLDQNQVMIEDEVGFERVYKPTELTILARDEDYGHLHHAPIKEEDRIPPKNRQKKSIKPITQEVPFEIDLHIEELLEYSSGLTNHEIVQKQLTACRAFVQHAIKHKQKRIVLIHGKGAGVLKSEIRHYLNRLDNDGSVQIEYHDANFNRYGNGGATEVILSYAY
jgi:hypothetical protein